MRLSSKTNNNVSSLVHFFFRWLVTPLKKETWTSLGVKRENVAVHIPGIVIARVLQGKNAGAIAHVNGNDHVAALNLQTGFQF